jgi:acetyl-CoA carboxylase biotin carboxyl carrier protein
VAAESDAGDGASSLERIAVLVDSLAATMRQSALSELDLDVAGIAVRLRRSPSSLEDDPEMPLPCVAEAGRLQEPSAHVITAPMIGTFYASPNPGAAPFVTEGDEVFSGQIIGIIEAMKIMNEIAADKSGIVEEVMVGNGQPVEFGSPLIRLATGRLERR